MSDENAAAADDLGEDEDVDDSSRSDGLAKEPEDEKPSAADDSFDSGYDEEASFPARVNVIIEKVCVFDPMLQPWLMRHSSCSPAKALSRSSPSPRMA